MPRTASQPLKDAVNSESMCAIDLWTFEFPAGTYYRWTTFERDVSFGGNTWSAAGPVIDHGATRAASGVEVSTLDLELKGVYLIGGVSLASLAATGAMDDIAVTYERLYLPTYATTPTADYKVLLFSGYVVDVEPSSTIVKLVAKSILARADEELPRRTVGPMCGWSWGSTRCGINKSLWQASDTVAAGSTTQAIKLTTGTAYAVPGAQVQFADGQWRNVVAYDAATKTATLDSPLAAVPATGSALTIWRSCDKAQTTCSGTYANLVHFGGFPQVPGHS